MLLLNHDYLEIIEFSTAVRISALSVAMVCAALLFNIFYERQDEESFKLDISES